MTGPEHYRLAEELIDRSRDGHPVEECTLALAEAQVHATLALAAATALASHDEADSPDHQEWHAAASLTEPEATS